MRHLLMYGLQFDTLMPLPLLLITESRNRLTFELMMWIPVKFARIVELT
jgi:hypothetical protein